MSPAGRPKSQNAKDIRLEIRLNQQQQNILEDISAQWGLSKTEILMRGLNLVKLQKTNREFRDLSDCLLIRESMKSELDKIDREVILQYIMALAKKYK